MADNLPALLVKVIGLSSEPDSTSVYEICKEAAEGNALVEFQPKPSYGIADAFIMLRSVNGLSLRTVQKAHDELAAAGFNVLIDPTPLTGTLRKRSIPDVDPDVD